MPELAQPSPPINGIQLGITPARSGWALHFNGSSEFASAPLQYFSGFACSVSAWVNWTTFANNDALAMELSPNFNSNGGFLWDPNSTGPDAGKWDIGVNYSNTGSDSIDVGMTRPAAGTWNHIGMSSMAPQNQSVDIILEIYLNGIQQAHTFNTTAGHTVSWGAKTLFLMCRNGASLFGQGAMADLAIWREPLVQGEMTLLAGGVDPRIIRQGPDYYWTLGTLKPETSLGRYPAIMTPSGGTLVPGPGQLKPAENLMAFARRSSTAAVNTNKPIFKSGPGW